MHLSFLTSHNLLFFSFCKTSKKTTFSVFLSFFLVKFSKSQSLKLIILRTAWPILMILVSFCRILNGLSDEINLFWRCSSPLKCVLLTATSDTDTFSLQFYIRRKAMCRVSRFRVMIDFLRDGSAYPVFCKTHSNQLPPPQARNTLSISCATTTTESDNQEYFKHFAPARLLSERCTLFPKVAHPSVSLPPCTGMSLKIIKT